MTQYQYPEAIVPADELAAQLDQPGLRIFDCTMYLRADSPDDPYRVVSGRADYEQAHVPGAAFLDLQQDLSDPGAALRFTMPSLDELTRRFAENGIGDEHRVVLYSRENLQWATRVWWMLRAVGFDRAAILDGGWEYWQGQGLPQRAGTERYPAASLTTNGRPGLFVDRQAVQAAQQCSETIVINALSRDLHAGRSARYGRPGRIPGSVNLPATGLRDPQTGCLLPAAQVAQQVAEIGLEPGKRAVLYCGGGIAATLDAFILHQLGYSELSVYDNSLNEWAKDPSLPMESDA